MITLFEFSVPRPSSSRPSSSLLEHSLYIVPNITLTQMTLLSYLFPPLRADNELAVNLSKARELEGQLFSFFLPSFEFVFVTSINTVRPPITPTPDPRLPSDSNTVTLHIT